MLQTKSLTTIFYSRYAVSRLCQINGFYVAHKLQDSQTGYDSEPRTLNATASTYANGNIAGYTLREELPLPDKPPYTVHLGNLSFEATSGDVTDFFVNCQCTNVRIIEDKVEMKPKGFGYAEFASRDGLKQALTLNGHTFHGRNIRISVADPRKPKDRGDRSEARDISEWSRKGPLPDLPARSGMGTNRREVDRSFGADFGGERRERFPETDGKSRDRGNWERKGPLSPIIQPERAYREGGRPRTNDTTRLDNIRDRKSSPAAWGEGGQKKSQEESRPPRREVQDRPVPDRAPTAAEQDNQWRSRMKPDVPITNSPIRSRDGSEAPSSPALGVVLSASRPKLNLSKRTVSDTPEQLSNVAPTDAKPSPFGAAKPIDTAAKEREIEEKRLAAIKEKREADEKASEEKREAAKALKGSKDFEKIEILKRSTTGDPADGDGVNEANLDNVVKTKEPGRENKPKPSDSGAWRRASHTVPSSRDDIPRGPRGARGGPVGGSRGRGEGPKPYDDRVNRKILNGEASPVAIVLEGKPEVVAQVAEEDGWSTVSKAKKNNRSGNQSARAVAS
ncbi:translation initiation factor 4B [Blumeria hordei DH14]|uniref:Translation initiation factor 4B n=1 Tax=Blumeria graminis f. sp. hordei (strain DH14) TaxID=546991 RepID=N1J8D3_BLUG1|nr:translation initiation factor 4B [Blumeria hordei DH14]